MLFRLDELTPWIGLPTDSLLDDLNFTEREIYEQDVERTTGIRLSEFTHLMNKNVEFGDL